MTYRLPSLKGLRAFEAAARHLSFKHAAAELCVTPGAISQQVKALEQAMGVSLFRRLPRGLLLTKEGESYLLSISDAFRTISRATDDVSATLKSREFRLGIAPALGHPFRKWISSLRDVKTNGPLVVVSETDNIELLLNGRLELIMRPRIEAHPGLHLEQLRLQIPESGCQQVTLAMLPGLSGCREHKLLLSALQGEEI